MAVEHIEFLVEEPSMEAFLRSFIASLLGEAASFEIYPYQGKDDLLNRLGQRLRGYAAWLPDTWLIVVIVDRDDEDCTALKDKLEEIASNSTLATRRQRSQSCQVLLRISIEELEAWYFGDWAAVRFAYPRAAQNVAKRAAYRNCDQIQGGTWEAFEREMQRVGYFAGGLRKIEAARKIGKHFDGTRCTSPSYKCFEIGLLQAIS